MDNQRHESSHRWLVNISSHEFEATELVGTCGPVTSDKWFITETQKDTPRTYRYFINNTPELDCQTLGLIICPNKNGMFNQQKYAHVDHRCRPQWMIVIWKFHERMIPQGKIRGKFHPDFSRIYLQGSRQILTWASSVHSERLWHAMFPVYWRISEYLMDGFNPDH